MNWENLLPNLEPSLQIVVLIVLLSMLPLIVVTMTPFLRIVIILSLLRTSLGTQQVPPNMVLIGMALILTGYVMGPTLAEMNETAFIPLSNQSITVPQAVSKSYNPLKRFMLKQTDMKDLAFFYRLTNTPNPANPDEVSFRHLVASFLLSELRTSFQIGFLIFIPFLVIDLIVANILLALGMIMLSPTIVSLPFKLLIFVAVDGWTLIVKGLVQSFG
ncbi:MAG: flagellar type III secretion system pore protein FliP [Candidatus Melainabacteria bacterium]|nr:flagellar type III secretion system pore protein FliP [Candidatus Melainabacteria bacterium]MBI3307909.1 flagellar type III secretion system pore protein FliP [Candidatus Melainabacteria bacterium]